MLWVHSLASKVPVMKGRAPRCQMEGSVLRFTWMAAGALDPRMRKICPCHAEHNCAPGAMECVLSPSLLQRGLFPGDTCTVNSVSSVLVLRDWRGGLLNGGKPVSHCGGCSHDVQLSRERHEETALPGLWFPLPPRELSLPCTLLPKQCCPQRQAEVSTRP